MLKDVMVHLDGSAEDATRLAHAEALARWADGVRLTGLFTNVLPEYGYVLGVSSGLADMGPVIELEQRIRREGDRTSAALSERLSRIDGPSELRRIDDWPSMIPGLVASQARCADLFVATTPYRDSLASGGTDRLIEAVLFEGGRGLYLVPPGCPARSALRTVLIAWKDTRESARAIAEAMPLLRLASRVALLAVDTADARDRGERETDIAAHLDRQGVRVEVIAVQGKNVEVGDIIQAQAERLGADLIVMGAYGHSRLKEWVLGGATRDLVERTTIPLLMAH